MVDVWRVKSTGEVIKRTGFAEKRHQEAGRMAFDWFMYGLVGVYFAAYNASRDQKSLFTKYILIGIVIDCCIAVFTWFDIAS